MSKEEDVTAEQPQDKQKKTRLVRRVKKEKPVTEQEVLATEQTKKEAPEIQKVEQSSTSLATQESKQVTSKPKKSRHVKPKEPNIASDDQAAQQIVDAPKVIKVKKRQVVVEPILSDWAKDHKRDLSNAKISIDTQHTAGSESVNSLAEELAAIKALNNKISKESVVDTSVESETLLAEIQIAQENYDGARSDYLQDVKGKQKEAEVAYQDVVAAEDVLRDQVSNVFVANRDLAGIVSDIKIAQASEAQLMEAVNTAQKDLVSAREGAKQEIEREIETRKKTTIVDENELVKVKAQLDGINTRVAEISQTLGERLMEKASSKEELSELQNRPKEQSEGSWLDKAAAKVKELRSKAGAATTSVEIAAREKLIESSRADLDKALKEQERLTTEADLLSKKILTSKQGVDEMQQNISAMVESTQKVQNQKELLEGKLTELGAISDRIGNLGEKQQQKQGEIVLLEAQVVDSEKKVGELRVVAETKLTTLKDSYTPKESSRATGQKYEIQSSKAKEAGESIDAKIAQKVAANERAIKQAEDLKRLEERAKAEKIAQEKTEAQARYEEEQKVRDEESAKSMKESRDRIAQRDAEIQKIEAERQRIKQVKAAEDLKIEQEAEAKQKERDRVSSLSTVERDLTANRRTNRNLQVNLGEAKDSLAQIIIEDATGKYKDLLRAQNKVKQWESELNDSTKDKGITKTLIRQAKMDLKLVSNRFPSDDPLIVAQNRISTLEGELKEKEQEFRRLTEQSQKLAFTKEEKQRIEKAKTTFKMPEPEPVSEVKEDQEQKPSSPKSIDDVIKQAKACATEEEKAHVISEYVMSKIEDAKIRYQEEHKDIVDIIREKASDKINVKVSDKDSEKIRSEISQFAESVYGLDPDNSKKVSTEVFFGALKETGTIRTTQQWIEKKLMNLVKIAKEVGQSVKKAFDKEIVDTQQDWEKTAEALKAKLTTHAATKKPVSKSLPNVQHQTAQGQGQGIG